MDFKKRIKKSLRIACGCLAVIGIVFVLLLFLYVFVEEGFKVKTLFGALGGAVIISAFIILPIALTIYNIYSFIRSLFLFSEEGTENRKRGYFIEFITIPIGVVYTLMWSELNGVMWNSSWQDQLVNSQIHPPLASEYLPTVAVIGIVAVIGYLLLRMKGILRLPPLITVFSIGAMYLGVGLCIVWIIQMLNSVDPILCAAPTNFILIAATTVGETVASWQIEHETDEEPEKPKSFIGRIRRTVQNSANWPWLGIIFALPILGVMIAILTLFGQSPDSVIRAWTETADWTLSQKVAPQNIYVDEHYLCTVAAGGHPRLVKPIREGKRHGHKVIVNRQLCVANAFEQILEERTPRFHRLVRGFYDKYGYPVAKHIKSQYAADVVWILMKPLEWLFLAVLYLCDVKPENRIAVQYPHSAPPKI